ncbi:MAG TPA: homoserine O-succinyltransferase [Solirubrobacteraceae bacterium]|nr:homoserine O-succinyltransferase [Solirubrobacteraceae bacterium]
MALIDDAPCSDDRPVTVALVNNMPDSAFVDTEDQFRRATTTPEGGGVTLELYTITDIPRSHDIASVIDARYRGLDDLWANPPDALIVTGTEPTQVEMVYEPYWPYLAHLLEWAAAVVPTVLLSCLASHASILLFDGIERVKRPRKCSGVFRGAVTDPDDPLAVGLPHQVAMPHSRVNEVPEEALLDAGYRIVVGGADSPAGWAVAARECGDALFVLCQGHPEYSTLSLLREYRRDVRRFLFGRGTLPYPCLPEGYLSPLAVHRLDRFAARASRTGGDPRDLWAEFPYHEVATGVQNTWAASSTALYTNWIRYARAGSHAVV